MKIGCHAVLFTDRIARETEEVLKEFEKTGCQGVEIGARFFGVEKSSYLKELLDQYHLQLSGLHVSALWTDLLDDPQKVEDAVGKAVEFLQVMPNKNIIFTGMAQNDPSQHPEEGIDPRLSDPAAAEKMAGKLNEIAAKAKESGGSINYHNHCWEFDQDGLLFMALIHHAPEVRFALDTGWAAGSGWDPADLLEKYPDRISYVHLRDFKKEDMEKCRTFAEKQENYVDLGKGNMDYERLLSVIKKNFGDNGWAVIEYEKGKVDFERYTKAVSYVREILG